MQLNRLNLGDAAARLIRIDEGVIVADTCSLLDVIRAPLKGHSPVLEAAFRMYRRIESGA